MQPKFPRIVVVRPGDHGVCRKVGGVHACRPGSANTPVLVTSRITWLYWLGQVTATRMDLFGMGYIDAGYSSEFAWFVGKVRE